MAASLRQHCSPPAPNSPQQNYKELFRRIASWLRPEGLLFFHIFVHARGLPYHYEVGAAL